MSDPYVGEIRIFAGNFAPLGWSLCQGQLVPISEYETLFALIGTTYGGDGQETFGLPDLQSRVPLHQGTLGGNTYVLGEMAGNEIVTLTTAQMAQHSHQVFSTGAAGTTATPGPGTIMADEGPPGVAGVFAYTPFSGTNQVSLRPTAVGFVGGDQPHDNLQPYLAINYIISMYGVFPSQN